MTQHCLAQVSTEGEWWKERANRWAFESDDKRAGEALMELVKGAGLSEEWQATAKWLDAEMRASSGAATSATDVAKFKAEALVGWESQRRAIAAAEAEARQRVERLRAEAIAMARAAATWEADARAIAQGMKAAE